MGILCSHFVNLFVTLLMISSYLVCQLMGVRMYFYWKRCIFFVYRNCFTQQCACTCMVNACRPEFEKCIVIQNVFFYVLKNMNAHCNFCYLFLLIQSLLECEIYVLYKCENKFVSFCLLVLFVIMGTRRQLRYLSPTSLELRQ